MSMVIQLETLNQYATGIPMSADEMKQALGDAVVYVDELEEKASAIRMKDFLNALSVHGCEVDFNAHTFRITDLEAFTKFILNGTVLPKGKVRFTTVDFARLMDSTLVWLFGHYPTVLDGNGYDNIFFALRHHLFGKGLNEHNTYRVVAVFYGKV